MNMKVSQYIHSFKGHTSNWSELEKIFYNIRTNKFITPEKGEHEIIEKILKDPNKFVCDTEEKSKVYDNLVKSGFLIVDELDELAVIKMKDRISRYSTEQLVLSIIPTMACNLSCTYCSQSSTHANVSMSKETIERLLKFVETKSKTIRSLVVRWWGGEPLLRMDVVDEISQGFLRITREKDIKYSAVLTTNGYLLRPDLYEHLVNDLCIKSIQVTLDGPREEHDKRRIFADGRGTFDRIMNNLEKIVEKNKTVTIMVRVNIDKANWEKGFEIIHELDKRNLTRYVMTYLAPVVTLSAGCPSHLGESCIERTEFYNHILETLHDGGGHLGREAYAFNVPHPNRIKKGNCAAVCLNSYIVDPDNNLYKCNNEIGFTEIRVGYISGAGDAKLNNNVVKWLSWSPLEAEECKECKFLPICMGGCAFRKMKHPVSGRGKEEKCNEIDYCRFRIEGLYYFESLKRQKERRSSL